MPAKPDRVARDAWLIPLLQRSPRLRSTFYLGSMVVLLSAARALNDKLVTNPKSLWYQDMNTTVFPAALALSYVFARLRSEDLAAWHRAPTKSEIAQLGQGLAMGTTAMLAVFGTAAAKSWISAPTWGWEHVPMPVLLQTIAGLSAKYAIAAWEEEIVFRGYGFDALRQAIGPIGATVVSAVLFARYHGPEDISTFLTLTLGGVMFTLLRLKLRICGYHSGFIWPGIWCRLSSLAQRMVSHRCGRLNCMARLSGLEHQDYLNQVSSASWQQLRLPS